MPIVQRQGSDFKYYLIAHGPDGAEKIEPDGDFLSRRVLDSLAADSISDVFYISHGWKGDLPAALQQYDNWIAAMEKCQEDLQRARAKRSGFRPLVVGFHWPSLPFGDERIGSSAADLPDATAVSIDDQVRTYSERIADSTAAREALRTIFSAAHRESVPSSLPSEVRVAYETLDRESQLRNDGIAAPPGHDRAQFDPDETFQFAIESQAVSFGLEDADQPLLWPLRQLSFWKMKDRARQAGEAGGHQLLRAILVAAPGVRLHGMGHSFGSIVLSAAVAGPPGNSPPLPRPVHSLVLVQGALSLWSYSADNDYATGPGYFRSVVGGTKVAGPILTTRSRFDQAVGRWYPLAAGAARQMAFDADPGVPLKLPRYGGVGAFGLRGSGLQLHDLDLGDARTDYRFESGHVHNMECSRVICLDGGRSDAHCDISHPEVAHAVWAAALS